MKTEAVMCMAFTRHNPSWTALFRTNCSIVLVMFTNPRRLGTSNQRCSVNVFIQSFNRYSWRGWLFAAARFARVGLEVVPGLIFVNESLNRHRPVMMGLGFGTSTGKRMAEILSGERPAIGIQWLNPDRYDYQLPSPTLDHPSPYVPLFSRRRGPGRGNQWPAQDVSREGRAALVRREQQVLVPRQRCG